MSDQSDGELNPELESSVYSLGIRINTFDFLKKAGQAGEFSDMTTIPAITYGDYHILEHGSVSVRSVNAALSLDAHLRLPNLGSQALQNIRQRCLQEPIADFTTLADFSGRDGETVRRKFGDDEVLMNFLGDRDAYFSTYSLYDPEISENIGMVTTDTPLYLLALHEEFPGQSSDRLKNHSVALFKVIARTLGIATAETMGRRHVAVGEFLTVDIHGDYSQAGIRYFYKDEMQVIPPSNEESPNKLLPVPVVENDLPEGFEKPRFSVHDIGGYAQIKQIVEEIAVCFNAPPEVLAKYGEVSPSGVLIHGEPGNGKTMFAHAIADKIDAPLFKINAEDITEKWHGDSEKIVAEMFKRIGEHVGPLVVLIDEFETVFSSSTPPEGSGGATEARNAVAGIFKKAMDTLPQNNPQALVIAITNHVDRIDPSLIRSGRFNYKVGVPNPDLDSRRDILAVLLSKKARAGQLLADDVFTFVPEFANETDGFSGSDLAEVLKQVSRQKMLEEVKSGSVSPITRQNIRQACDHFRRNK